MTQRNPKTVREDLSEVSQEFPTHIELNLYSSLSPNLYNVFLAQLEERQSHIHI